MGAEFVTFDNAVNASCKAPEDCVIRDSTTYCMQFLFQQSYN